MFLWTVDDHYTIEGFATEVNYVQQRKISNGEEEDEEEEEEEEEEDSLSK